MSDLSPLCAPKRTSVDHFEFMGSRPGRRGRRPEGLATKFLKFRNFACQRTQITSISITVLPTEGRAHVTNAERDAVDAAASGARKRAGRMMLMRTAKSCGSDAPKLASSLREEARTTVTTSPIAGESAK